MPVQTAAPSMADAVNCVITRSPSASISSSWNSTGENSARDALPLVLQRLWVVVDRVLGAEVFHVSGRNQLVDYVQVPFVDQLLEEALNRSLVGFLHVILSMRYGDIRRQQQCNNHQYGHAHTCAHP